MEHNAPFKTQDQTRVIHGKASTYKMHARQSRRNLPEAAEENLSSARRRTTPGRSTKMLQTRRRM